MNIFKKGQINLLEGNAIKSIFLFAIPIFITTLVNLLYSTVDGVIVGHIIPNQYAGINDTGAVSQIAMFVVGSCASGFSAICGNIFGSKDKNSARKAVAKSFLLSVIISLVLTAVMILFMEPLLKLLGLNATSDLNTYTTAKTYLYVIFGGMVITMLNSVIIGIIRSYGDALFPMLIHLLSSGVNALFTFLAVMFLPDTYLKVAGAAFATIFSQLVSFIINLIYAYKKYDEFHCKKSDFKLFTKLSERLLRDSLPIALEWIVIGFGLFFIQGSLISFDAGIVDAEGNLMNCAQNAKGASGTIKSLMYSFSSSLSAAVMTFVAQNKGANQIERIKPTIKKVQVVIFFISLSMILISYLLSINGAFLYLFLDSSKIYDMTKTYAHIFIMTASTCLIFHDLHDLGNKVLIGLEKPLIPSLTGFVELILRFFLIFLVRNWIANGNPNSLACFIVVAGAEPFTWIASFFLSVISSKIELDHLEKNQEKTI